MNTFAPINVMQPDQYFFFIILVIIIGLYIEHRRLLKQRYEPIHWGGPAKNTGEFHERLLTALKHDEKLEKTYKRRAYGLFLLGIFISAFAIAYAIHVAYLMHLSH